MKKQYVAPVLGVELYELTQSIAACTLKIGATSSSCVEEDGDATPQMRDLASELGYFLDTVVCERAVSDNASGDGVCYHTNMTMAFKS